jgi:hypothetical protein
LESQELLKELAWGDFGELLSPKTHLYAVRCTHYDAKGNKEEELSKILDASLYEQEAKCQAALIGRKVFGEEGYSIVSVANSTYGALIHKAWASTPSMERTNAQEIDLTLRYAQKRLQIKYPLN